MKKDSNSIIPISRNEMGQLKGGFSVYSAESIEPIKKSVTVSVKGTCLCKCISTGSGTLQP